jgi:serine/threonine-protein kinase
MSVLMPLPFLDSQDERLARVLSEVTDRMRRGESPELKVLQEQHPEVAKELKEIWPALVLAEELAKPTPDGGRSVAEVVRLRLPSATASGERECPGTSRENSMPLSLPRTFGDYELLEEIGRGGMGVVYKARQRSLNRLVALKMILRGELASDSDLARFRAEAESAARLEHPNIVPVYDVGDYDGQAFFTMQLVEGSWSKTLRERAAQGPLPPRDAARYLAAISRAIDFAHQRGVLHRDLKPSNILIDTNPKR